MLSRVQYSNYLIIFIRIKINEIYNLYLIRQRYQRTIRNLEDVLFNSFSNLNPSLVV